MLNRRKVAAGLGGLTLMLGTIGGSIAVHAASPAASPPAVVQPAAQADTETADGPDTGTAQDQQGTQVEDTPPIREREPKQRVDWKRTTSRAVPVRK